MIAVAARPRPDRERDFLRFTAPRAPSRLSRQVDVLFRMVVAFPLCLSQTMHVSGGPEENTTAEADGLPVFQQLDQIPDGLPVFQQLDQIPVFQQLDQLPVFQQLDQLPVFQQLGQLPSNASEENGTNATDVVSNASEPAPTDWGAPLVNLTLDPRPQPVGAPDAAERWGTSSWHAGDSDSANRLNSSSLAEAARNGSNSSARPNGSNSSPANWTAMLVHVVAPSDAVHMSVELLRRELEVVVENSSTARLASLSHEVIYSHKVLLQHECYYNSSAILSSALLNITI